MAKNLKTCPECGKTFECPPSSKKVTCSKECQKRHAQKRQTGIRRSEETKLKISRATKGRNMSNLQVRAIEAVKKSPKAGRFETNLNAKDWHLVSPEGKHYRFHSLNFWLRENCKELFGFDPDSRQYKNAVSGLCQAKRAVLGKTPEGQRPCYTYKGWEVIPTEDDINEKAE